MGEGTLSMDEPLAASPTEEYTDEGATFAIIDNHICAPPSSSHPDGFQLPMDDLLGARTPSQLRMETDGATLLLGSCPRVDGSCCTAGGHRQFVQHRYACGSEQAAVEARVLVNSALRTAKFICEPEESATAGHDNNDLQDSADGDLQYVRRMLVIINPAGGSGNAKESFEAHPKKMLAMAMVHLTVVSTEGRGHATQLAHDVSLEGLDGIIVVGGDGLFHEVFIGVSTRMDAREALKVPLGHIPCGSGNGLCESLCAASGEKLPGDVISATWLIARGSTRSLNVAKVWGNNRGSLWSVPSVLSTEWAVIADIDIESEACRCIGSSRFFCIVAQRVICCLRKYTGTLQYLPPAAGKVAPGTVNDFLQPNGTGVLPSFDSPVGTDWKTIEGDFGCLWICNTSHMAPDCPVAPNTQLDDGLFHLIVIPEVNRCSLALALGAMDEGGGEHLDLDCVEIHTARAYRLVPKGSTGRVCVDGELMADQGACSAVQSEMFGSVAKVFASPFRNFDPKTKDVN